VSFLFEGIRILDLTRVYSGPFATRLFADYGAEVIKIESPERPDDTRGFPPMKKGWSGYYEMLNRRKTGLKLDLKNPKDYATFINLVRKADVVVENLTPSVKTRLEIDYPALSAHNHRLIYASLAGIGQESDRRYYDIIAQAESGLMSLSGTPEQPMKIGPAVVDAFSGLMLAYGIASALFARERTGKGCFLDTAMLDCAVQLLESHAVETSLVRKNPTRLGNQDAHIAPFGTYHTKNGFISIAVGNGEQWSRLSSLMKQRVKFNEEKFKDNASRITNQTELTRLIENTFAEQTTDEAVTTLNDLGIACSPVRELLDVIDDEGLYRRGALEHVKHPKLGKITVPGRPLRFRGYESPEYRQAPS
jgi:crotonobetainyl-CoA:carnitine CoA-transferase CaiB-like acyl-CoA transferase